MWRQWLCKNKGKKFKKYGISIKIKEPNNSANWEKSESYICCSLLSVHNIEKKKSGGKHSFKKVMRIFLKVPLDKAKISCWRGVYKIISKYINVWIISINNTVEGL